MDKISTILTFCLYLAAMQVIGWVFYRRTKNLSDYILGGRELDTWIISLSAQASDMSGWLLLGLPGFAYMAGLEAGWIAIGLALGTYLNWKLVAKRLRIYTEIAGDSLTLPDYFENRFRDKSKALRIVSAVFIIFFFMIYTASGFVAGAKLFNSVFGLPYEWALAVGVLVIISYTFLGGFMAVCWTDFFQGIMMFLAVLIVPMIAVHAIGGVSTTINSVKAVNPELLSMFTKNDGSRLTVVAILSLMAWGLGYFGQPHILARFMAIRSSDHIPRARVLAMIWVVVCLTCAVIIGLIGVVYLKEPLADGKAETVFMAMVNALTHPLIGGVLLAAILAAIMSTADSQLLVTSSALTEDIYKAFFRRSAGGMELVWVSRSAVIFVALIAGFLAISPKNSVLELVAYAWGGFGAAFGPLIILSLFWKRMTRNGAIAGVISGGLTVIIWRHLDGAIFELYELAPGFILGSLAIIIVSLIGREPSREILEEFDKVTVCC